MSGSSRSWIPAAVVAALVGAVAVGAAVVGGLWAYDRFLGSDGPPRNNRQDAAGPLMASTDVERGDLVLAGDELIAGFDVAVSVTPPPGATEMQLGTDPSFATTPWRPVASEALVVADSVGYQMVFGRFRAGPSAPPSPVSVLGVTIDPTYEAATASAAGPHRPSWARPLSTTTLVIRIEGGRLERGGQLIYDVGAPPSGDRVDGSRVVRNGEPYGRLVEGRDDVIFVYDRLIGRPLDVNALDGATWTVTSPPGGADHDPAFAAGIEATVSGRFTRPSGSGIGPDGDITPLIHDLVVEVATPLQNGHTYVVEPAAGVVDAVEIVFDDSTTVSPAIRINQNGYGADDALKVGYLSGYPRNLGGAGYRDGLAFSVIDGDGDAVVFEGVTTARPGGDELDRGDLTGVPVFELDFSPVTTPGTYRVCVEGIGCSPPFEIAGGVWEELAIDVARAMYHQRSGVALGPPYTAIGRPRPYHPDDGLVVNGSSYRLLDGSIGPAEGRFAGLVDGRRPEVVPEAWGGHFDAGDWDRRIEHLYYLRAALELVDLYPDRFGSLALNIPESGDAVPDLIDEGLWSLDLFLRLQRSDGAVPGGIEAAEHPLVDTTSWTDPLDVFVYDPDPWSSYVYAGVAAQAATVVEPYDPVRAGTYLDSALAAVAWADAQPPVDAVVADAVTEQRSVAAAALLAATGDSTWHDVFVGSTTLDEGVDGFLACHEHGRCDAAWIYLRTDPSLTDPDLRDLIAESVIATADDVVAIGSETSFGWTLENRFVPLVWGLGLGGAPNGIALVRAHALTGDDRYLTAAQRAAAASLGANTTGTSFVTGVGFEPVRHPLIVDVQHGGLAVWPGTPVYGHHTLEAEAGEEWIEEFVLGPAGVDPLPTSQPYLWQWLDTPEIPMFNEYTVFQSHGQALLVFGFLAAAGPDDS